MTDGGWRCTERCANLHALLGSYERVGTESQASCGNARLRSESTNISCPLCEISHRGSVMMAREKIICASRKRFRTVGNMLFHKNMRLKFLKTIVKNK